MDKQLDSLKEEVESVKQHYSSEEVRHTIFSTDDVLLLQHKELDDMEKISSNIDKDLPGMEVIVDTAQKYSCNT